MDFLLVSQHVPFLHETAPEISSRIGVIFLPPRIVMVLNALTERIVEANLIKYFGLKCETFNPFIIL